MAIIWTIVGIIIPFFLGLALSFLGYNPPEFRTARTLVWAASGILTAWTLAWVSMTSATRETQVYTVIGVGILNVVSISASMLFIGSRNVFTEVWRSVTTQRRCQSSRHRLYLPPA